MPTDHGTLSLLRSNVIKHRKDATKIHQKQEIFCFRCMVIKKLEGCEICNIKCSNYYTLNQILKEVKKYGR